MQPKVCLQETAVMLNVRWLFEGLARRVYYSSGVSKS